MVNDDNAIGLFLNTWPAEFGRSPRQYYLRAVHFKANPRSKEYMQSLFMEYFPGGEFIDTAQQGDWPSRVQRADRIVLLYPDATGIGFCKTERKLIRIMPKGCIILALNGRRRLFEFNWLTRKALYLRRLLERYMIGEITAAVFIMLATPFLWLWDQLRGKR